MGKLTQKEINTEIEIEEMTSGVEHNMTDPTSPNWFENFCSACDNIGTENCPFGVANNSYGWNTRHELLGCTKFWD